MPPCRLRLGAAVAAELRRLPSGPRRPRRPAPALRTLRLDRRRPWATRRSAQRGRRAAAGAVRATPAPAAPACSVTLRLDRRRPWATRRSAQPRAAEPQPPRNLDHRAGRVPPAAATCRSAQTGGSPRRSAAAPSWTCGANGPRPPLRACGPRPPTGACGLRPACVRPAAPRPQIRACGPRTRPAATDPGRASPPPAHATCRSAQPWQSPCMGRRVGLDVWPCRAAVAAPGGVGRDGPAVHTRGTPMTSRECRSGTRPSRHACQPSTGSTPRPRITP